MSPRSRDSIMNQTTSSLGLRRSRSIFGAMATAYFFTLAACGGNFTLGHDGDGGGGGTPAGAGGSSTAGAGGGPTAGPGGSPTAGPGGFGGAGGAYGGAGGAYGGAGGGFGGAGGAGGGFAPPPECTVVAMG